MNNRYLNINARLAEELLRRGLGEEFRVLLALKGVADGSGSYFQMTSQVLDSLRGLCGWKCRRTPKKKIERLVKIGWVGKDSGGTYYIRSFDVIKNQFDITSSAVHQVSVPWICESKSRAKSALFSIALGKIIADRQHALVRKNAAHVSTGGWQAGFDLQDGESYSPDTLSTSFLGRRLGVSKATIHRWKHQAIEDGLIERTKRRFKFSGTTNPSPIRSAFPEEAHRTYLFFDSGEVAIQLTDSLDVGLKYKSV
jgi:hypothetical protein